MRAHQIMTREVITIAAGASIVDPANIMLDKHTSGLPVVDGGRKPGQHRLARRLYPARRNRDSAQTRSLAEVHGRSRRGRKVGEIMTPDTCAVTEDATLEDIVDLTERYYVKRLPVLRGDKMIGIVTRTNLLRAVAGLTRDVPDSTADDDHIRNRIVSAIERSEWAPVGLGVIVVDGIVHLSGLITNEKSRGAVIVAAENVSVVTKVHDHICWKGPIAGMYLNSAEDDRALRDDPTVAS
jgi:predicted transcriptional regulator